MGRYGNIDGIATLTNNPNATDNAKRRVSESKQVHLICRAEAVSPQAKGTIGKIGKVKQHATVKPKK